MYTSRTNRTTKKGKVDLLELSRRTELRVHLLVTVVVGLSLFLVEPRTTLVFGGSLCFITYLYIGIREARKTALFLSPLSFYFLWYIIGMGLSPIYIGLTAESADTIGFASMDTAVSLPDLASGYVMYL